MKIEEKHKQSKQRDYWNDLSVGTTTRYKEEKIEELIKTYFPIDAKSILDVGSGGNCDHVLKYQKLFSSERVVCVDYDEKIIREMKSRFPNEGLEFKVADIFALESLRGSFDLVFFLDMLHEIYSFYGRPEKNISYPVNHEKGQEYILKAVENISRQVSPHGGVIITDNIVCGEDVPVLLKLKTSEIRDTVSYFLEEYPSKEINASLNGDVLSVGSRDLCTLLTQYNKIKKKEWERWDVEKMEIHQYMTLQEYTQMFDSLGFKTHAIVETPGDVFQEWSEDFEIIEGLRSFPKKRITLLAVKND